MSRASVSAARNLTLTEELEKLEQSITLTLQEIDHNFSRAHRIVTTSILPIVEQYAKHSEAVWDGSKFWKQFFEASANVSLSGYEEAPEDLTHDETTTQHEEETYDGPSRADDTVTSAGAQQRDGNGDNNDPSILDSPSLAHAHSTPRMPATGKKAAHAPAATFADYPSPYETLKREMQGGAGPPSPPTAAAAAAANPSTPGKPHALPDMSMTPQSSPFAASAPPSAQRRAHNTDPLLHRVLDKTYRIAATPHTQRAATRAPGSSPPSSPAIAAPQLRPELFSSPAKTPRTPGVSVQTPGAGRRGAGGLGGGGGGGLTATATATATGMGVWDDSDGEEETEFSPPKTMQFHVPQSRLLQTPAREASKRIVEDLLLTAGGDITDELDGEDSPSVVRRNQELDDSF